MGSVVVLRFGQFGCFGGRLLLGGAGGLFVRIACLVLFVV